jgi:hypothetical protein
MNKTNSDNKKSKQPVYVLSKSAFDSIFHMLRNHTSLPAKEYGTIQSKEEINKALNKIKFDENDEVLVSKVMEVINEFYSYKLVPGTNSALDSYKTLIKVNRKNKKSSLQQI